MESDNEEPKSEKGITQSQSKKTIFSDYRLQVVVVITLCVAVLMGWQINVRNQVSTDNAVVRCNKIDVVSEVTGVIDKILFEDNELVNKGKVVVKLRDAYYRAGVNKARAELDAAVYNHDSAIERRSIVEIESKGNAEKSEATLDTTISNLSSVKLQAEEAKAKLNVANNNLAFLKEDLGRVELLYKQNISTKRQYQEAKRLYESGLAERDALQANLNSIRSKYKTENYKVAEAGASTDMALKSVKGKLATADAEVRASKSQVELAQAEYDLASILLERTSIKALRTGHITNRRLSEGEFVEIGQPIASITSCVEQAWVEANFKETQIGRMKSGQLAKVYLDTHPDVVFTGHVEGISSGSGATFSVLPPENAVGNFTKVVQRFPVKINIVDNQGYQFRMGMSAIVKVIFE